VKIDNFFAELKRRNVFRAAALYAAGAWLLVQVATQVFPFFHIAEWVVRWIVIAAIIGFPFAMLFSWFYEWTPQGLQRESEVLPNESRTRQTGRKLDRWIIAVLALAVVLLLTNQFVLHRDANSMHLNFASYLAAVGRYDEAEAALRRAISLQPSASQVYMNLAIVQIQRGRFGAALASAKKESDPFFRTCALALAEFAHGDRAQADAQDAEDGSSQIASVYALRKEPDKAVAWLEHAWTTHDPGVGEIMLSPFLRAYKDDPRSIAFAQKIGVMPKPAGHP
jgi:tetratricopeptide (TPR) repeat protein